MHLNYLITIENPIKNTNTILFNTKHILFANTRQIHLKKIDETDRYIRIKPNYQITSLDFTLNKVIIGNAKGQLIAHQITDLDKKKIVKGHYNNVNTLTTRDNLIATGSYDKVIKIWDLKNFIKPVKVLNGHKNWITSLKFQNQQNLISGSNDKTVKIWDIEKKNEFSYNLDSEIYNIHCKQEVGQFYVSTEKYLLVIDQRQKKIAQCFPLKQKTLKIFDIKDNLIVTGHQKHLMSVFDIKKGVQIQSPQFSKELRFINLWKYNQYIAILTQKDTSMYQYK